MFGDRSRQAKVKQKKDWEVSKPNRNATVDYEERGRRDTYKSMEAAIVQRREAERARGVEVEKRVGMWKKEGEGEQEVL